MRLGPGVMSFVPWLVLAREHTSGRAHQRQAKRSKWQAPDQAPGAVRVTQEGDKDTGGTGEAGSDAFQNVDSFGVRMTRNDRPIVRR
ncbi:hypothetical protein PATSB16_12250 [Pandoraea thiooxydans]|nr:hypothetical protein PATSB16_12250 [Pandoraea thiooxydans]